MKDLFYELLRYKRIVVVQADNPDADSLASSLALEHILGDAGVSVDLYCGVDIPKHLRYLSGWDRIQSELPRNFDASIIVDCANITLLEQLERTNQLIAIKNKPVFIIDHHASEVNVPFDHKELIDIKAVATGEVIYQLAKQANLAISPEAADFLSTSIMADSLGLSTEDVTAQSIFTLAELVEKGANLARLDAARRAASSKSRDVITYKGQLLQRIEYYVENQLAIVSIPWKEIEQISPHYNPAILALEELRFADGVKLAVVLKHYPDGKITGKLRCNYGSQVAGDLAAHFGGGGHASASGFKTHGWKADELKLELIAQATKLLTEEKHGTI